MCICVLVGHGLYSPFLLFYLVSAVQPPPPAPHAPTAVLVCDSIVLVVLMCLRVFSIVPLVPSVSLQPENVILDRRRNVKLTGFALAGLFDPGMGHDVVNLMHLACGTPDYTAPEVSEGEMRRGRIREENDQSRPHGARCCYRVPDDKCTPWCVSSMCFFLSLAPTRTIMCVQQSSSALLFSVPCVFKGCGIPCILFAHTLSAHTPRERERERGSTRLRSL